MEQTLIGVSWGMQSAGAENALRCIEVQWCINPKEFYKENVMWDQKHFLKSN